MKTTKISLCSMIVIAALAFSCNEDDDATSAVDQQLEGTWTAFDFLISECDDPDDNIDAQIDCSADFCHTITLQSSGTFSSEWDLFGTKETQSGTYTTSGNDIEVCITGEGCASGTYLIQGNTLTLSTNDLDDGCNSTITYRKD